MAEKLREDRTVVTRALDKLADLALLRRAAVTDIPGTPLFVPPRAGLGAHLERRQNELACTQTEMEAGRAAVADLLADYTAYDRADGAGVERFTGAEAPPRWLTCAGSGKPSANTPGETSDAQQPH
ncbi:hypothetical protein ACWDFL_38515 [Streptomyces bungoensis]